MTNHCRKRNFLESLLPWIPHESTFVPSSFYIHRKYDTSFKSAMDFDFFLYFHCRSVPKILFPFAITKFSLGGTSSNVLLSCSEYKRSIIKNNIMRNVFYTSILSYFFFFYLYFSKFLFILKSRIIN